MRGSGDDAEERRRLGSIVVRVVDLQDADHRVQGRIRVEIATDEDRAIGRGDRIGIAWPRCGKRPEKGAVTTPELERCHVPVRGSCCPLDNERVASGVQREGIDHSGDRLWGP